MILKSIKEYLPDSPGALESLRSLSQLPAGQAYLHVLKKIRSQAIESAVSRPKHSPDDLTKDVVYELGIVKCLNIAIDDIFKMVEAELKKGDRL